MVCQEHQNEKGNLKLLDEYKLKIFRSKENIPSNFVAITPLYTVGGIPMKKIEGLGENRKQRESAVYMFQRIEVDGNTYNLFFDSGCGDLVCRKEATTKLGRRANQEVAGPTRLFSVGDKVVETPHGIWKIQLPMADGNEAMMSGVCLDKITQKFPDYEFDSAVKNDILDFCRKNSLDEDKIPTFPSKAGGETDIMIGIQYQKYFPVETIRLPSGLTIYESKFVGVDGSRGIIAGPHASFTAIEARYGNQYTSKVYICENVHKVNIGTSIHPVVSVLGFKEDADINKEVCVGEQSFVEVKKRKLLTHEAAEMVGTICNYRCINCRGCKQCKEGENIEAISLQEEYEQHIIDRSVTVDIEKGVSFASLPFIERPEEILVPNREEALKILQSELRRLTKCQKSKDDVVESENKLQELGHVQYIENLTADQQMMLCKNVIQNFIPWRSVWSKNSVTTPCRLVFDASHSSKGRKSLNSLLAKGTNNMNKLLEIVIRWSIHKVAFHTDIQKMYNTVRLKEEDWCCQRYLWQEGLDCNQPIKEKIITTLIYGVKSSGNQAENALRKTANKMKSEYPEAAKVINDDIYVDDCISGRGCWSDAMKLTDNLKIVLARGGFALKGFTFAGRKPPENLSDNSDSIKVAGMNWFPEKDVLQLCTGDMNFDKKKRGKKNNEKRGIIPDKLTKRQCVGKVAEVFDLCGKVTPIIAGMKLDLRILHQRKLEWDDRIPDDLRQIWLNNFDMMQEISELRFQRNIIPIDAETIDIETLEFGDSSNSLICSAIYARVKRKNGSFSCQLVFSRSKILPEGTSIPRGELAAAHLNSVTGLVVRRSFGDYHKKYHKFTDSQVTLFWIHSRDKPLKQWVRSRVIEINRLDDSSKWFYIQSQNNIADIGTRKGVKVKDVDQSSLWRNGYFWMHLEEKDFPTMTVQNISLQNIKEEVNEEMHKHGRVLDMLELTYEEEEENQGTGIFINKCTTRNLVPVKVDDRYRFCNYLIDPNKYRLRKVVRIMALVQRFVRNIKLQLKENQMEVVGVKNNQKCIKELPDEMKADDKDAILINDPELMSALEYFYRISTMEIKEFRSKRSYETISEDIDGILYYKGRILIEQDISGVKDMCDVMIDLSSKTFWVPLVDRHSPFAYSIVNEVHWHNKEAKHTGVEKTLRYTMQYAHILEGRSLVSIVRKSCTKCRLLAKEQLKVIMGPVSKHNLNIAPAFYITQVDLVGPLESYHGLNKRTKLKIWFIVFCCCTTGAVDLKVMDSYTTNAFILGFKRFGSRTGFPKMLLPDQGSQLLKACGEMTLKFKDIQGRLNTEYGVEFKPCPVGSHYMHGKVERKIRQVRESISRSFDGYKMSVICWETMGAEIANCINDLPIGIINANANIGNLDLLTPNRLLMGRNNNRSPVEPVDITCRYDKIIGANNEIFRIWFKCWLTEYVPLLMRQQKWFKSDRILVVGDIIMFKKSEKEIECKYQYGIIKALNFSKDKIARSAVVEYQNSEENVKRTTIRGIRELILIQHIDEIGMMHELDEAKGGNR